MFSEVWNMRVRREGQTTVRYVQTERDGLRVCRSDLGVPNNTAANFDAFMSAIQPKEK
jgi:hypothetical protein